MTCPDCKGSGSILLFTSAKPCAKCGGTGKQEPVEEKVNDSVWTNDAIWTSDTAIVIKNCSYRMS